MDQKVIIKRLSSGVPGLDEVLGGGLPELSFNLLGGPPGSGKTTLAHQMMFAMASPERPALYLTVLGEPPLKMLRYQQQFEFFDIAAVGSFVHFVNLTDDTVAGDLDALLRHIANEVETRRAAFVFVDSFRSMIVSSKNDGKSTQGSRMFVQRLGMLMTSWRATTFLLGEFTEPDGSLVFTVADGLIWLRQSLIRNSVVRKLQVAKMRGQATAPGLHTFRIDPAGVKVFGPTREEIAAELPARTRSGSPPTMARVPMGTPGLDGMLGGGLPHGYSLLVAGPSGSGKSIMAASFLKEGARAGETGVIAAFEQRLRQPSRHPLAALIQGGSIGLIDSRVPDLSIGEVLHQITAEVRRLKATRVVIDSLSGFELSLAPTFRQDFRESLARMVATLATLDVCVLMTSELEDRYTDLRFSPYGTAFMTDAIIVQRYVEVDSHLRRVMAVVKVRASAHSDELRLFTIDDSGIRIGDMLVDQEGLLGGRPTAKRSTSARVEGESTAPRRPT
jgi:circadian clock protein KaiC